MLVGWASDLFFLSSYIISGKPPRPEPEQARYEVSKEKITHSWVDSRVSQDCMGLGS